MRHSRRKVLMLCKHPGNLIEYTRLLNGLGFFCLTLCSNIEDAEDQAIYSAGFDIFIYDDFRDTQKGREKLKMIGKYVAQIVLLSDTCQEDASELLELISQSKKTLINLLPRPINPSRLDNALSSAHMLSLGK